MSLGPCDTGLRSSGLRPSVVSFKPVLFGPSLKPVWDPLEPIQAFKDRFTDLRLLIGSSRSFWDNVQSGTDSRSFWDQPRVLWVWEQSMNTLNPGPGPSETMSLGPCDIDLRSSGLGPSEVLLKPVLVGSSLKPVWDSLEPVQGLLRSVHRP